MADRRAQTEAGVPLLIVPVPNPEPEYGELNDEYRIAFRIVASAVADLEINLTIGNLGWEDFVIGRGEDGVHRGSR